MHQLLEIRSVILTESEGDHKGLITRPFSIQVIIPIHTVRGGIMVNMGGVQIKELHCPKGHGRKHLASPYLKDAIKSPTHRIVVEFLCSNRLSQKQLRVQLGERLGKTEQRTPSRQGIKDERQHNLTVTHPSLQTTQPVNLFHHPQCTNIGRDNRKKSHI